jgi:hypothetical protein
VAKLIEVAGRRFAMGGIGDGEIATAGAVD